MIRLNERAAMLLAGFCALSSLLFSTPAVAAPSLVSSTIQQVQARIPNLIKVDDNFYRGKLPDRQALKALKEAGIKVDISLCNERDLVAREAVDASAVGLKFINIPMQALRRPTADAITKFMTTVENKDKEPVYVHCRHGQDRTGAMCGLYRVVHSGWNADDAFREMLHDGFHPFFFGLSNMVFDAAEALGHSAQKPSIGFLATHIGAKPAFVAPPRAE